MLSVNDSVELLLLATAESPSSAVLSRDYSKESELSIPAQPNPTEHKIDRPAVAPSAGPGGYRRLRPRPGPGPGKWKSATPLFCFGAFQDKKETVETGEGERERKKKKTEKISQLAVSRDPRAGLATRQRPPPPPCLSSSTSAGIPSTEETGVDAAMQPTCQRANAQRAERHTHRLCISRGRTHSDPLREWSGPRLTCKRARAKIRFGGPGQRRPRQSASGQGF